MAGVRSTLVLFASTLAIATAQAQSALPPGPAATAGPANAASANSAATALDEISVTSTKTEERAIDTLGATTVIGRGELNQIQPDRISDMLRQVPGVTTQENHNDPAQAINIRGLQDFGRVNVLVDGARQNFQTSGHGANGVFFLDPELIGGIDITRGPTSTIYGSGAIGGVVSFRTFGITDMLKPDEVAGIVQKVGIGSNGYGFLNSTSIGLRPLNNAVDVFGQFVLRNTSPYQDGAGNKIPDTGNDLVAGNFKVNVRPAEGHEISATALKQHYDFANNGTSGTGARFASDLKSDTYTLGYRFTPPGQPLFDLSIKGYYTNTFDDRRFLRDSASGTYTALGARPGNRATFDIKTYGYDVFNTSRFDTGPVTHALTYGFDGVHDKVHTFDNAGGFGSAFTPSGKRELNGAFIQDELRYGGWLRVLGALRYDSYSLDGGATHAEGDRLSPRATIGVTPLYGIEVYGTYAEGYRAPTITEALISGTHPFPAFQILPNANLRPETAHNLEAGVNVKYDNVFTAGDIFRAKLNVYHNSVDNFIDIQGVGPTYYLGVTPSAALTALCAGRTRPFGPCQIPIQNQQYVNIAKAELSGFEGEAAYDWGTGFASIAYSHTDGINQQTRATLLTVQPDKVSGTFGLRFLNEKLTVGSRLTWVADRVDVPTGSTIQPTKDYFLADLFASYAYSDTVRGDITLANVFDRRYRKYLDLDNSPGFQARGSITVKFATK